ncbi:MAG TPA: DUF1232 domain-containing protein [Gemmatimonadaceae bacterium]|nr:DUF1232 domain-containing protein [Gemmatimonadaceae bacterium]
MATRQRSSRARRHVEEEEDDGLEIGGPRRGAKRTVMYYIRQLPQYLRLLGGLLTDRRVAPIDKLFVLGAIVYIVTPIDLIPDFIPFFGEIDDVYLLVIALQRLVENAGRLVLLDHWTGNPRDLADLNLRGALMAAAFFLPKRIRRRLRVIGHA